MTSDTLVMMLDSVVVIQTVENPIIIEKINEGPQGPPGPQGLQGPPGPSGMISADEGNSITHGSDGGLYCPAVITSTLHW